MPVFVFGPSAADSSWADAVDKVRRDLWRPSSSAIPDDQADRALHSALRTLEAERRWLWLEGLTGSLTMPAGNLDNVGLPASVKYVASIAYLSGNTGYDILEQRGVADVRQASRGSAAAFPQYYARQDKQLYFDCPVAENSQFELLFTSGCPESVDDAKLTPPATLTLQMPAIVAWAAGHIAETFLKDTENAARQFRAYQRLLDMLVTEEDTARADAEFGGSVRPDDYYSDMAFGG